MIYKRLFLATVVTLLFSFGLPLSFTASQSPSGGGFRVINISDSGSDLATSVAFSPDGTWLAVGSSSGVAIFDSQTLSRKYFFRVGAWARSVTFSPDGGTIAAGSFDGTVCFWNLSDGQETWREAVHEGWVRSVAFSPDGRLFAATTDDDTVRFWTVATGSLELTIPHLTGVRVLAFSPDGGILAVGLQDTTIQLLNISDGSLVKTLHGHEDWVRSLAFSPDGETLASGAFDAKVKLWDVASGQLKYTLDNHQSSVLGLSFAPDGRTLASGSVDGTVKLWNVADGSLVRTLVGHSNFVYSVEFSPDGNTLISGAGDNSIRLWDLTDPNVGALPQPGTPSDCRYCHHPRGTNAPPPVIQVNCEACHANGMGLNWCPFFRRSPRAVSEISYIHPTMPVGVPVSSQTIAVRITYPTNGETLYTTENLTAPLFVDGRVFYVGDFTDVTVHLQIWSGEQLTSELTAQPDQDGAFSFKVGLNSAGVPVVAGAKAADPDCAICHEDFKPQTFFPNGQVHFVIIAVSAAGDEAIDERWLTVDTSSHAEMDVQVFDKNSGAPIPGLEINAATVLYEWRDRYSKQVSGTDGVASLSLEVLNQANTTYEISVPPTSLNGYMYQSTEPVCVDFVPGMLTYEPLILPVEVSRGQINGSVSGAVLDTPLDIWAVHLPDGAARKVQVDAENFTFTDLPSGAYQIFADPSIRQHGFQAASVQVDLTKQAETTVEVEITPIAAASLFGTLRDESGTSLPFGWVTVSREESTALDPAQGGYRLDDLEPTKVTVVADAPGYYSQAQLMDLTEGQGQSAEFSLVPRPEMVILPWGMGNIFLPPESVYEVNDGTLFLTRGWAWGRDGDSDLAFHVAGVQITLQRGSFALEYIPTRGGWFYLLNGSAHIFANGQDIPLHGGQMAALSDGQTPIPVPYDATVVNALHSDYVSQIESKWEPSLRAQIRDRLAKIGISIAQFITFVTYVLVLIIIAGSLIGSIYSIWKKLRKS